MRLAGEIAPYPPHYPDLWVLDPGTTMLACVCQPADPGIFRRSPIPLGAPPLKIANRGAIPKPGRIIRLYPPSSTIVPSSEVDDGKTKCDDGVKNEPKQAEKAEGREEISTLVNAHCDKKSKRRAKRIDEVISMWTHFTFSECEGMWMNAC